MKQVYAKWKFIIVEGVLVRECTNCGYKDKHQPVYCPNCNAYMRERSKEN